MPAFRRRLASFMASPREAPLFLRFSSAYTRLTESVHEDPFREPRDLREPLREPRDLRVAILSIMYSQFLLDVCTIVPTRIGVESRGARAVAGRVCVCLYFMALGDNFGELSAGLFTTYRKTRSNSGVVEAVKCIKRTRTFTFC